MNSVQESKNELDAAIRYAENAISSAKQTIESMEFRQEMAKKQYSEQTGREKALDDENIHLQKVVIDLETFVEELRDDKVRLNREVESLKAKLVEDAPTMPVIPKAVAIAIFREGVQHGVESACTELDNADAINIDEDEYVGDFHVTFERCIDLSDHIDTDWMRGKCGDYSEETIIDALGTLCADKEFECRIHGVDDHQPFEPEHRFDND